MGLLQNHNLYLEDSPLPSGVYPVRREAKSHESFILALAGTPADEIAPWQPAYTDSGLDDQFFIDRFNIFGTGVTW